MSCKKVTFSLPEELVSDLNYVSKRMSVTRSALLSEMVLSPAADLRTLFESIPENPTPDDVIRARGSSLKLIEARMNSARSASDDLLSS